MSTRETPLAYSFCKYVVADEKPMIITDARIHPRLHANPAVQEMEVIAYIGCPLVDQDGRTVGSLCAMDSIPRAWTAADVEVLLDLAQACSAEIQHSRRIAEDGETLTRSIFSAANVAMAFYDTNDRLVLANEQAHRVADVGGFRLEQLPHGGAHAYRRDSRTTVPLEGQSVPSSLSGGFDHHQPQWIGQPGKQVAVVGTAHTVMRSDGTPWGTLVAAQDVTDLARALQVKDELIATVSHELRTPLTSVRGYLEILTDELEAREGFVAETLTKIEHAALALQRRLDELLDAGIRNWILDAQATDVWALAQRVVTIFSDSTDNISIRLTSEAMDSCQAVVDAARIEQLLENLLSNALKFTGSGGCITVSVSGCHESLRVAVADDGIGMSEDEIDQAFDSFWRSDHSREQATQGLGIGLTVVRRIVDAHHGSISVSSLPGRGTTVEVTVPRTHPSDSAIQLHRPPGSDHQGEAT